MAREKMDVPFVPSIEFGTAFLDLSFSRNIMVPAPNFITKCLFGRCLTEVQELQFKIFTYARQVVKMSKPCQLKMYRNRMDMGLHGLSQKDASSLSGGTVVLILWNASKDLTTEFIQEKGCKSQHFHFFLHNQYIANFKPLPLVFTKNSGKRLVPSGSGTLAQHSKIAFEILLSPKETLTTEIMLMNHQFSTFWN